VWSSVPFSPTPRRFCSNEIAGQLTRAPNAELPSLRSSDGSTSLSGRCRNGRRNYLRTVIQRVRTQTIEKSARVRTNDWITSQRRLRAVLGDNLYDPLHRFTEAVAVIQLIELDSRVRSVVNEAVDYVERLTKHRDKDTLDAWRPLRRRILDAIAASGDAPVIEAAESSESIAETDPISAAIDE
jgi:hypothetical protein